jgi:hypothetical protein
MKFNLRFQVLIIILSNILSMTAFCQKNESKDTVVLREVIVQNNSNVRIAKIKTKKSRNEIRGFNKPNSQFVSLVKNIPKGQLSAVSFFFNPGMLNENVKYDLGVLIFTVDMNGQPGKPLSGKEIRFKLSSGGKGKIKLDLKELFLNSEKQLFFGFAVYNDISRNPLLVKFSENKSAVSFCKEPETVWLKPVSEIPIELQLVVEVIPDS